MKLAELYNLVVELGIKADPRKKSEISKVLDGYKKEFNSLKKDEKPYFDKECFKNPYSDTRILCADPKKDIKRALIGIDIGVSEMLLADRLNQSGKGIDLVWSHHPQGKALAGMYKVMGLQADILSQLGMSVSVAEGLIEERVCEVERKLLPVNHSRVQDAAELLGLAFMCTHTPADNQVYTFLKKTFDRKKPYSVSDIIDILMGIPEYKRAASMNAGPKLINGKKSHRAGKIHLEMTGGTEGPKDIYKYISKSGVGTIVVMHLSEEHFKKAKGEHVNIIVAGHIASDVLGMNLLLDQIEKKHPLKIIGCSGFFRCKH